MIALLAVVSSGASALTSADVPFEVGGFPIFPRTDIAIETGGGSCTTAFDVAPDGTVSNVTVSGCPDPLIDAVSRALAVSKTTTKFAAKHPHVDLVVDYPKPAVELAPQRRAIGDEPVVHIPLERAVRVDAPWPQYVEKRPYASRDEKGGMCTVEVYVTGDGSVYAVDMDRCADRLYLPISMAAFEWKYTPQPRPDGSNGPVRFEQLVLVSK